MQYLKDGKSKVDDNYFEKQKCVRNTRMILNRKVL